MKTKAIPPTVGSLAEVVLATWQNILGYTEIDLNADFFELGGDSLQAARMTDRLSRSLGIEIDVDMVFDVSQAGALIAALEPIVEAAGCQEKPEAAPLDQGRESVPLGPNQQRFMDRDNTNPNHFNTAVLLKPRLPIKDVDLQAVARALVARHDALRIRFTVTEGTGDDSSPNSSADRRWNQLALAPGAVDDSVTVIDLSAKTPDAATEALIAASAEAQLTLDLMDGPVFRILLFELPDQQQRILILAHHLVSDRVSLLLMMDWLADGLLSLADGRKLQTGAATSVLDWTEALRNTAATPETTSEAARWLTKPWNRLHAIPVDRSFEPRDNRNENVAVVRTKISAAQLPTAISRDIRLDEVILASLCSALGEWNETDLAHVDVLGFGRRLPVEIDVTRSVGMFITYSPIMVDLANTKDLAHIVPSIRQDLDQSWRLDPARLSGPDQLKGELAVLPQPQVLFNFVGKAVAAEADGLLMEAPEPSGPSDDRSGRRAHLIAVRADVADEGDVTLVFVYSSAAHDPRSIEMLAAQTKKMIMSFGTAR